MHCAARMNAQPVVDIPSLSLMDWWFSASSGITALRIQFLRGECILEYEDGSCERRVAGYRYGDACE
jgi:hypothetical protein